MVRARASLAFWQAEQRYQLLWKDAKRARRATTKAASEAEALAPHLSAIPSRSRALLGRVLGAKASSLQAAAELRSARLLSGEAAALAEALLAVSQRAQRYGAAGGQVRSEQVKAYLGMAREALASARMARSLRARARRALFRPTWLAAGLGAHRATRAGAELARQALAAKLLAQRAAAASESQDSALAELAIARAAARKRPR